MQIYYTTDKGGIRENNEDSIISDCEKGILIVADGMGGHVYGEIASKMAVELMAEMLAKEEEINEEKIRTIIQMVNVRIYKEAKSNREKNGMGTTLTGMIIKGNDCFIGHIGDSRAYLIRKNTICQITKDHSLVQSLIDKGILTRDAAREHPLKNVISQALGLNKTVNPDVHRIKIEKNDVLFLCTDGLSNPIKDEEILSIVIEGDFESVCDRFLTAVKKRESNDNITFGVCVLD